MKKLSKSDRLNVAHLYQGFPGLHGALDAAFEGSGGEVYADDKRRPNVARIVVGDFHAIAGDPVAPAARDALMAVPKNDYIAISPTWRSLLRLTLPEANGYDRFSFRAPRKWDVAYLERLMGSLKRGYELIQVDKSTVREFARLNPTFVANFSSTDDFLRRGAGFAVTYRDRIVAGCSTYSISSQMLEFEIETAREFQRRGLALVTGAAMITLCLKYDLEPAWDAAHEGSALLAERLGFIGRKRYTAYRRGKLYVPES